MMKKLLSILIATFFLSNIVTYAQKENNPFTEIALTQAKRKDPISKGDTPISRSIIQTANAYLYNNTVCVDFNEVLPNVTITLINESTSKLIHSEAYNEPTNIDITLDEGYSSGNYLIKIEFFYMVISHYNNHTTNNTLFKKIESHEKVIPIYELGNAYIIQLCR